MVQPLGRAAPTVPSLGSARNAHEIPGLSPIRAIFYRLKAGLAGYEGAVKFTILTLGIY